MKLCLWLLSVLMMALIQTCTIRATIVVIIRYTILPTTRNSTHSTTHNIILSIIPATTRIMTGDTTQNSLLSAMAGNQSREAESSKSGESGGRNFYVFFS